MSEEYFVRDFMTAPVTSIPHDARLVDAVLLLRRTDFRHLPVMKGDRVVGILSERDIQRVAPSLVSGVSQEEYNQFFNATLLEQVMTPDPLTVTPDTPLREATAILNGRKVGCVPVVEDGRLVGIITVIDMLGLLHQLLSAGVKECQVRGR